MRILLVTDAWAPQINGVVVTLRNTITWLGNFGHDVEVISPEGFRTMPMPSYPEIPLALFPGSAVRRRFNQFRPEAVHIATEGPLGLAARKVCIATGQRFTTAYHTCFPEYVYARTRLPVWFTYRMLRWFHRRSAAVMVATPAIRAALEQRGFDNVADWSRGVDTKLFRPAERRESRFLQPVFLYVGRVAVEKNIAAFLQLDLPGTKVVVGDGPQLKELEKRFPATVFAGAKTGQELVSYFQMADVFVFPSRTDTFGLVLLEAMACGTPCAAFPVNGPIDVITDPAVGVLDEDLRAAALAALKLDRVAVRRYAESFSWERCARQFFDNLVSVPT